MIEQDLKNTASNISRIWSGGALLLFLAVPALIWILTQNSLSTTITADDIAEQIRALQGWALAISLGLMILCALSPLPAEAVAIANGMVYGASYGFAITWASALIGSIIAFALARALGRPAITALLSANNNRKFDTLIQKHGAGTLLLCRSIPLVPYFLLNFAFGLSPMRWWTYIWISALGMIPMTVVMVLLGDRLNVTLF